MWRGNVNLSKHGLKFGGPISANVSVTSVFSDKSGRLISDGFYQLWMRFEKTCRSGKNNLEKDKYTSGLFLTSSALGILELEEYFVESRDSLLVIVVVGISRDDNRVSFERIFENAFEICLCDWALFDLNVGVIITNAIDGAILDDGGDEIDCFGALLCAHVLVDVSNLAYLVGRATPILPALGNLASVPKQVVVLVTTITNLCLEKLSLGSFFLALGFESQNLVAFRSTMWIVFINRSVGVVREDLLSKVRGFALFGRRTAIILMQIICFVARPKFGIMLGTAVKILDFSRHTNEVSRSESK